MKNTISRDLGGTAGDSAAGRLWKFKYDSEATFDPGIIEVDCPLPHSPAGGNPLLSFLALCESGMGGGGWCWGRGWVEDGVREMTGGWGGGEEGRDKKGPLPPTQAFSLLELGRNANTVPFHCFGFTINTVFLLGRSLEISLFPPTISSPRHP